MDASKPQAPLEIPELLEVVLLHLTQGEILQAQRVNHFWADTISESPLLQQKLFFQPLPPSKAAGRPAEFNPIVEALFPFLFESAPFTGGWFLREEAEATIQHWAANPASRQAVLRPEASWRRMLPVQPAAPIDTVVMNEYTFVLGVAEEVYLMEWCKVDPSRHVSSSTASSNLGGNATVGLLYDIVVPHLNSTLDACICVQWNMVKLTHDLCYKTFLRLGGKPGDFRKPAKACMYRQVKPRNAITIHVDGGPGNDRMSQTPSTFSPPRTGACIVYSALKKILLAIIPEWWSWNTPKPADPTGLGVILDLPAGVVRVGNKTNRYPKGNMETEYLCYGKLAPGLESELEIELRERVKDRLLASY